MGYVVQRKVFLLRFADPELKGLEVRAKSSSLGEFLDLIGLADLAEAAAESPEAIRAALNPENLAQVRQLFDGFAEVLVSWNLQEEDPETGEVVDVPATAEGMRSLDVELGLTIVAAWMDAITGVTPPLSPSSSSGGQSPAASLPMEPLSASRAS